MNIRVVPCFAAYEDTENRLRLKVPCNLLRNSAGISCFRSMIVRRCDQDGSLRWFHILHDMETLKWGEDGGHLAALGSVNLVQEDAADPWD